MKAVKLVMTLFSIVFLMLIVSCASSEETDSRKAEQMQTTSTRSFNTIKVELTEVKSDVNITGRVIPYQKVEVVAQVQGIAKPTGKRFKEGVEFRAGQIMVSIDNEEFKNNLTAQKSQFLSSLVRIMSDLKVDYPDEFAQWNEYLKSINIDRSLPSIPKVDKPQLKYYLSANSIYNLFYGIKSAEETLAKYEIKAPFNGTIVRSSLDVGSLVRPNTKLGEFIRTDRYEIQASVSITDIATIEVGQTIRFISPDVNGQWDAVVNRIGRSVDPSTQAVAVYLTAAGEHLKEGMYLEGKINTKTYDDAIEISKGLITRNNQVYLIEDSTVQLKTIELLAHNDNKVIVRGLKNGDELITDQVQSPIQGIYAVAK